MTKREGYIHKIKSDKEVEAISDFVKTTYDRIELIIDKTDTIDDLVISKQTLSTSNEVPDGETLDEKLYRILERK